MERLAKRNLRLTAAFAMAIFPCLAVVATYLIWPGTPGKSRFMKFEGYIELPKSGPLSVLDYLTINNGILEDPSRGRCGCNTLCPIGKTRIFSEWRRKHCNSDRS